MTTTTALPHTKVCPRCGETFRRGKHLGRDEWIARRYCSQKCYRATPRPPRASTPKPRRPAMPLLCDQDWLDRAACSDRHQLDVVSPETKQGKNSAFWMEEILRLCEVCPVTADCLAYGLATRSEGVWGGMYLSPPGKRATAS